MHTTAKVQKHTFTCKCTTYNEKYFKREKKGKLDKIADIVTVHDGKYHVKSNVLQLSQTVIALIELDLAQFSIIYNTILQQFNLH